MFWPSEEYRALFTGDGIDVLRCCWNRTTSSTSGDCVPSRLNEVLRLVPASLLESMPEPAELLLLSFLSFTAANARLGLDPSGIPCSTAIWFSSMSFHTSCKLCRRLRFADVARHMLSCSTLPMEFLAVPVAARSCPDRVARASSDAARSFCRAGVLMAEGWMSKHKLWLNWSCICSASMSLASRPKGFSISIAIALSDHKMNTCKKAKINAHSMLPTQAETIIGVNTQWRTRIQSQVCA
mmetsp:Transcript_44506/g.100282  ORF Transcript_44506/g.100282 Transcript_44506/m.100282 type:complete len:240 (-) Transcript_44506:717-1436(-)